MINKIYSLLSLLLIGSLAACSGTPRFDVTNVSTSLTPAITIADFANNKGKQVLWGGTILDTVNLKDNTQIEVLAYPLDSLHRPQLEHKPLGRFIIRVKGYVESASYSPGKQLSVRGEVSHLQSGKIGERDYNFPVIQSEQLHLWPEKAESKSNFHFGIGIGIHN